MTTVEDMRRDTLTPESQGPVEAPESPEEPETGELPGDGPEGPEEPAEEPTAQSSEKDTKAAIARLDKEATRHRGRLDEILEEGALSLLLCPLCEPSLAGWYWPGSLPPEVREIVAALTGDDSGIDYETLPNATTCTGCNGRGEVLTTSKVAARKLIMCPKCIGFGYLVNGVAVGTASVVALPSLPVTVPVSESEAPPDTDFLGRSRSDPNFGVLAGYER